MTGTYPTPATIPCIDSPTRTLDHAGVRCPDLCAGRPLPPAGRERAGGEFDQPNPCRLRHRSKQEFRHAAGSDRTAYSCLSSWGDARPGERLVVPRPVVPSAQFVERRGVTATWSMRLLQPWRTSSLKSDESSSAATCRELRPVRLAHRPGDAVVPPGAARRLSAWRSTREARYCRANAFRSKQHAVT